MPEPRIMQLPANFILPRRIKYQYGVLNFIPLLLNSLVMYFRCFRIASPSCLKKICRNECQMCGKIRLRLKVLQMQSCPTARKSSRTSARKNHTVCPATATLGMRKPRRRRLVSIYTLAAAPRRIFGSRPRRQDVTHF